MAREAVIAKKAQTIEGGVTVQAGDEIPANVAANIGEVWFNEGFVERVIVQDEPKPKPTTRKKVVTGG